MVPRGRRVAALIPVGSLIVALWSVSIPYFAEGPGPARDVEPLIRLSGHAAYPSSGHFILTSVTFQPLSTLQVLGAWLDPVRTVVSEDVVVPPGETSVEADRRAVSQMDQSKIDAAYVTLSRLTGYPKDHGVGVRVESVFDGLPASGLLYPGDLIVSVDGTPTPDLAALDRLLASARPGVPLAFRVLVDGSPATVRVAPTRIRQVPHPVVGIGVVPNWPFALSISSGDIGGPSAGLMWALGLYDLLTPGDLTHGRTVAGTGQIDLDGKVQPIGGVAQKIAAAKRAGATVFLVPRGNLAEARPVAGGLRLIPVGSFGDALRALASLATTP